MSPFGVLEAQRTLVAALRRGKTKPGMAPINLRETRMITRRHALLLVGAALLPGHALAQGFPSRVIKIVVPYPAGGPTDALARIVAQELSSALGQSAIVENVGGGAGAIGTRQVAKAEPDGHTLVLSTNQTHATNYILLKDPGYDAKDFAAVAGLADLQHVLVVKNDLAAGSVAEFVEQAKAQPGRLNYGSTGNGSASHLAMELFKAKTGTDLVHVPFRGAAPMAQELVAGRIDAAFATLPSVLGQIQGGTVRALAVASAIRAPQLPDVPLLAEQGVAGGEADAWIGLWAPAATPPAALAKLTQAVTAALAKPELRDATVKLGIAVNLREPKAFDRFVEAEIRKWAEVVKAANVKVDG
ncbi:MAG: tripartite tricarboxylate transporter substrate binding protein [Microvirga sp.]|jgi:tripartite-type tricarboxylate transporter receptor subunit TctC|nr:tripartite tricarboxylate transporter substrate binding protein [Microvirga sp.]